MGRWKLGDNGGYYDPNDSGPDQVQPQTPDPSMAQPGGIDQWTRYGGVTGGMPSGGPNPYDAGQLQLPQVMHTDPMTGESLSPEQWYQRQGGQQKLPVGIAPQLSKTPMARPGGMQSPYIGLVNGPRVGDTLTPPEMSLEQAQSMQPSVLSALQGAGMGRLSGLISGALGGSRPIGAAMGASPFSATGKALGSALGSPLRSLSGFLRF